MHELLVSGLFAAAGGAVNTLASRKKGQRIGIAYISAQIFIAIFAGLLVHYLATQYGYSNNIRTAAVAIAGYSARGILAVINSVILQKIKLICKKQ